MSKAIIDDLIIFFNDDRVDLRRTACSTVLKLTGTADGINVILSQENLLYTLLQHIQDPDSAVAEGCLKILINISSEEKGSTILFNLSETDIIEALFNSIKDPSYSHANLVCGILANMTRWQDLCPKILTRLRSSSVNVYNLVFILCQIGYNKKGESLDMLAPVIANFTQCTEGRREILNSEKCIFERLLPFTDYAESSTRRKAVISAIHNCCFEKERHGWLLGPEVDLASRLLLPLAGPDAFTLEENETLPLDLQFLPDDKRREEDPAIRALLLEALMQLCATRKGRETLREQNVYLILREHHKWEKDKKCLMLNEDVVNLLIKTEEEIGEDDLSSVEVPSHLIKKFTDFDTEMLLTEETEKENETK